MITTGIIKNILKDINNTTIYKVDIPIFRTPGFTKDPFLFEATASVNPGTYNPYVIDDLVYIGFVDNKYSQPVILGKIYKDLPKEGDESATYQFLNTIKVTEKAELPINTTIGDITYQDLIENLKTIEINSDNLVILSQGGKNRFLHTNENDGSLEWIELPNIPIQYLKKAEVIDGVLYITDQDDNVIEYDGSEGCIEDVQMPNGTSIVNENNVAVLPDYGISYDDENIPSGENQPNTDLFRTWIVNVDEDIPITQAQTREIAEDLELDIAHTIDEEISSSKIIEDDGIDLMSNTIEDDINGALPTIDDGLDIKAKIL